MSTHRVVLVVVLMFVLLAPITSLAQPVTSPAPDMPSASNDSMLIIENAGQWPDDARFQVWGSPLGAGTTWLAEDAIWLVADRGSEARSQWTDVGNQRYDLASDLRPLTSDPTALRITFPGSNPDVRIVPFEPLTTTVSYFIGNDPAQWRPDVPVWGGVRYLDLYPGVDLVLDGQDDGWRLEAAPGAAVEHARVQVEGAGVLALDGAALELAGTNELLSITLPTAPFTYQVSGMSRQGDPQTLIAPSSPHPPQREHPDDDPGDLLYSTFLGGSGSDEGSAIAVDEASNAYVTGITYSSNFPTTPGAFDPSLNGTVDAFAVKLNLAGNALVYATFLGGSDWDWGYGLVVDGMGCAFVTGMTPSSDFPTTPGAFDPSFNGSGDAFVVKLNPAGSGLDYSTFVGGSGSDGGDQDRVAIAVDGEGSAYITGVTGSNDFPTTPGAFDPSFNGGIDDRDAFVAKLNPAGSALAYATFLGGSGNDGGGQSGAAIAVDETGSAYVTGTTASVDFPTTPSTFDPSFNGTRNAFLAKLNPAGSALAYATYLGCGVTLGRAISVGNDGSAYVTGLTNCTDFPTTPGVFDPSFNGSGEAFVTKLNPAGSELAYGTFLGGTGYDGGFAIAVDEMGNAHVTGETGSADFPTTPGAFATGLSGINDAFLVRLNSAGSELGYASFLGGNNYDSGYAIAIDGAGSAYLTGETRSSGFPATPGAYDPSYNGGDADAFGAKLDMDSEQPCCDFDGDGTVDVDDITIIALLWGQQFGEPYDQDGDGWITIVDVQRVARWWGWPVP